MSAAPSSPKRRGLGRGLDALLGAAATSEASASESFARVEQLRIDQVRPGRMQPRTQFEDPALLELAESIRAQGIVQPLVVTPDPSGAGRFSIIAGERRFRAAQLAGLETVPAIVRAVRDDRHQLELALVENLQRSDLNALDEAQAYAVLLKEFGLTTEQIAERVGKSRPAVANAVRLLRLAPEVQALLREGRLTAGQARPLLGLDSPAEQARLAHVAVADSLSSREIEHRVAGHGATVGTTSSLDGSRRKARAKSRDANDADAAERLTQRLQTRVEIRRRRRGGEVRIHFHSEEELMGLYERLMEKDRAGRKP